MNIGIISTRLAGTDGVSLESEKLVETVYFKRPAVVNRYPVYVADIAPLGFQFAEIDGAITPETVNVVWGWLEGEETAVSATTHNYQLGETHFSYQTLSDILTAALESLS